MKEIIEINQRIVTEAPEAVPKEFGFISICRENYGLEELATLSTALKADCKNLCQKLNAVMPDDFDYEICVGVADPHLMIVYRDGPQNMANCPVKWNIKQSIFDQMSAINWGDLRREALATCQIFDRMIEEAKHQPSALPSTKELQKQFAVLVKKFIKAKGDERSKVQVLAWPCDQGWKDEQVTVTAEFEDMKAFCMALPDMMTTHHLIISVLAGGKPLAEKRIEQLKRQALKKLEGMPMSHAKALLKM